jgi:hypothetical protein
MVTGLHRQNISGTKNARCTGMFTIYHDSVFHTSQPGYGMRRKMQLRPQDMPHCRASLFLRNNSGDAFHASPLAV